MPFVANPSRNWPMSLPQDELLARQTKADAVCLNNGVDSSLSKVDSDQPRMRASRQLLADICADDWQALNNTIGSFADEHSTL